MSHQEHLEKRRRPRIETNTLIGYKIVGQNESSKQVSCQDVSWDGLCFLAQEALPQNSKIEIDFYLSTGSQVAFSATGEVVWQIPLSKSKTKKIPTGISFKENSEEEKVRFSDFVIDHLYEIFEKKS